MQIVPNQQEDQRPHIERHNPTVQIAVGIAQPLAGDLRPAARRCPQIDNDIALFEQFFGIEDFCQLERSTGSITILLRHFDVGIINMVVNPLF